MTNLLIETTERPLLFTASMAIAMLRDVDPKRQTRRLTGLEKVNDSPNDWELVSLDVNQPLRSLATFRHKVTGRVQKASCPYGIPKDGIWGRETLKRHDDDCWYYAADNAPVLVEPQHESAMLTWAHHKEQSYCPSIHAPKWSSRIRETLADIRLEQVQNISPEDAIAEGLTALSKDGGQTFKYGIPDRDGLPGSDDIGWEWQHWDINPCCAFGRLWDSVNGKTYPMKLNPWGWVLVFEGQQ